MPHTKKTGNVTKREDEKAPGPREAFTTIFKKRLDEIERDALASGLNITAICRGAKISRATPDRWRKRAPKTIEIIDEMEAVLAKHKKKQGLTDK